MKERWRRFKSVVDDCFVWAAAIGVWAAAIGIVLLLVAVVVGFAVMPYALSILAGGWLLKACGIL